MKPAESEETPEAPTPETPAVEEPKPEEPKPEEPKLETPEPQLSPETPAEEETPAEPSLETATDMPAAPEAPEAPTSEVLDKPIASPDESFFKKNKLYILGAVVGLIVVTVVVGIMLSIKNSDELEGRLEYIESNQNIESTVIEEESVEMPGAPQITPKS